jgi:ABC-type transport system substrate-binding protein
MTLFSHRPARRSTVLLAGLAAALLLATAASCSSDDDAEAATEPAGDTTSTTAADDTTTTAVPGTGTVALRGVKYCEVLLLSEGDDGFGAEVWNSMGMSDCPDDQWEALDAQQIAQERGALVALLNGPRYWTLDSISTELRDGAPETTFGEIGMFQAAVLELGDQLPSQTPYTERGVVRETVFGFDAGSEVYELVDPDGTRYIMQSWSQIVDPELAEDDLAGLGDRLELPDGWTFEVRTLEDDLDVLSSDGVATVVQDELQNTYQRIDAP